MSDDPARNDILRLDEKMSEASWIDSYQLAIYFIDIHYRYLITDCRCDSEEISHDTDWFVVVASHFIVRGVQGSSLRVSASSCLSCAPRGVLEYFMSSRRCITL